MLCAGALVTLVSPDVGGSDVDGIYRVDGPDRFTVVADIGAFSMRVVYPYAAANSTNPKIAGMC